MDYWRERPNSSESDSPRFVTFQLVWVCNNVRIATEGFPRDQCSKMEHILDKDKLGSSHFAAIDMSAIAECPSAG
jgi:hypothetical protein